MIKPLNWATGLHGSLTLCGRRALPVRRCRLGFSRVHGTLQCLALLGCRGRGIILVPIRRAIVVCRLLLLFKPRTFLLRFKMVIEIFCLLLLLDRV